MFVCSLDVISLGDPDLPIIGRRNACKFPKICGYRKDHSQHSSDAGRALQVSFKIFSYEPSEQKIFPASKIAECMDRWRATDPNDTLDKLFSRFDGNYLETRTSDHFFRIKILFRLVFACTLLVGIYAFSSGCIALHIKFTKTKWDTFRIVYNEDVSISQISNITFLRNGACFLSTSLWTNMSSSFHTDLGNLVETDTLIIRRKCIHPAYGSGNFIVQGSQDQGRTWINLASPVARWFEKGIRFINKAVPCSPNVVINLYPPWPWLVEFGVGKILLGFGCLCCDIIFVASAHGVRTSCYIGAAFGMLSCFNSVVAAAGYSYLGLQPQCWLPAGNAVLYFLLSLSFAWGKKLVGAACALIGCAAVALRVAIDYAVFDDSACFSDSPPIIEAALTALGTASMLFVSASRAHCERLTLGDAAACDAEWLRLQATGAETESLYMLQSAVDDISRLRHGAPRHYQPAGLGRSESASGSSTRFSLQSRKVRRMNTWNYASMSRIVLNTSHSAFSGGRELTIPVHADQRRPVESLDQLYTQALAVAPRLRDLVARLAATAGGVVDNGEDSEASVAVDGGGVGREAAEGDGSAPLPATLRGLVRSRWVKAPARAVEKAAACYGGDVSRLTDLCRGRLVFASADGVAECVRAVGREAPAVEVVGVRNGLWPEYDARRSAGFRVLGTVFGGTMLQSVPVSCKLSI